MDIKEKQITSICTLSSMDYLIASEIASRINYNVSIDLMQINVPYNELEIAIINKDVLELRDKYKFFHSINNHIMKFTVQKNELLSALNVCGRCIGKSTIPALEKYRFQITGKTLLVTGSNMEVFISKEIMIESNIQSLDILVDQKMLSDYLKTLVNQPLNFTILSKELNGIEVFTMKMDSSTGKFNISLENGSDYPVTPAVDSHPIFIDNQVLINGFYKTTFCVDNDANKIISNLAIKMGNGIQIIGANPFYLSTTKVFENTINLASLVLKKTAPDILYSISVNGETEISYSKTNVCFKMSDGTRVYSKLSEGDYPDIKGFFAVKTDKHIEVNVSEFLSALKRVVLFTRIDLKYIKIILSEAGITLESTNESEESATETISCEYSGDRFEIGIIADQATAVVSHLKSETMFMSFSGIQNPIIIKEEKTDSIDNAFLLVPSVLV